MNPLSIAVGQVTIIVIGLVLGFYFQRQQVESLRRELESLRREIDSKLDALRAEMKQGFAEIRMEFHTELGALDRRVERIEERLHLVREA